MYDALLAVIAFSLCMQAYRQCRADPLPNGLRVEPEGGKIEHRAAQCGSSVTDVFWLINRAEIPFRIERSLKTCACGQYEISNKEIPAHERISVSLTQHSSVPGPQTLDVYVKLENILYIAS